MFIQKYKYFEEAADDGAAEGGTETTTDEVVVDPNESVAGDNIEATWRDDWREAISGGDKDKMARMDRYSSPTAVADGLIAAQERIRSGELKAPYPGEGTDEDKAAWRTENGLPDSPGGYPLDLDNGLSVGDDDKESIDEFLQHAHETNQTPEQVKSSLQWYYDNQEKQFEARSESDKQKRLETVDTLRAEWGQDFRANQNAIQSFLDTMPEDIRENFASARMRDGSPVLSDPKFLQWALNNQLELNPATTLVPSGGNIESSVQSELDSLNTMMADKSSEYWKGSKSDQLQARWRELDSALAKMKARA